MCGAYGGEPPPAPSSHRRRPQRRSGRTSQTGSSSLAISAVWARDRDPCRGRSQLTDARSRKPSDTRFSVVLPGMDEIGRSSGSRPSRDHGRSSRSRVPTTPGLSGRPARQFTRCHAARCGRPGSGRSPRGRPGGIARRCSRGDRKRPLHRQEEEPQRGPEVEGELAEESDPATAGSIGVRCSPARDDGKGRIQRRTQGEEGGLRPGTGVVWAIRPSARCSRWRAGRAG